MSLFKKQLYLGDLVSNDWDGGIQIYEFPGSNLYDRPWAPSCRFPKNEVAVILQLDAKHLASVKILTQNGVIGWVNKNFLILID